MNNYNLDFITNQHLYDHVKSTVVKYRFDINLLKFNSNHIDPIKLTFDTKVYSREIEDTLDHEVMRQLDKSNTNQIGYFHQNIFKYINNDWHVPKTGYDIVNNGENIFVEMKNKHNTMNSASSQKTYMKMQATILDNDKATCMLVEIIAKNSQITPWVIAIDGKRYKNKNILRVSIDKFYEKVTGNSYAFKSLCTVLPLVISDVVNDLTIRKESNTVLSELKAINPDLMKSIYLLSFKKYNGFDNFNFLSNKIDD